MNDQMTQNIWSKVFEVLFAVASILCLFLGESAMSGAYLLGVVTLRFIDAMSEE